MNFSSSPSKIFTVYDNQIAGFVIFSIAIIGVCSNWTVAICTRNLKTLKNSFGMLTSSQALGDAIHSTMFAFYFCPMVIFDIRPMMVHSNQLGFILLICYDICICSHFFIALNRMCAICYPFHYEVVFGKRNTNIMIVISWALPITVAIVLYKLHDCDLLYSDTLWVMVFSTTEQCNYISGIIDFYKDISIVAIIFFVDVITIYRVHQLSKQISSTVPSEVRRRRAIEINFLKQAVLQSVVFGVELLTYFIFAWKFSERWIIFSLTTVAWNLVHTVDGFIIITFNKEFRKFIFRFSNSKSNSAGGDGIIAEDSNIYRQKQQQSTANINSQRNIINTT